MSWRSDSSWRSRAIRRNASSPSFSLCAAIRSRSRLTSSPSSCQAIGTFSGGGGSASASRRSADSSAACSCSSSDTVWATGRRPRSSSSSRSRSRRRSSSSLPNPVSNAWNGDRRGGEGRGCGSAGARTAAKVPTTAARTSSTAAAVCRRSLAPSSGCVSASRASRFSAARIACVACSVAGWSSRVSSSWVRADWNAAPRYPSLMVSPCRCRFGGCPRGARCGPGRRRPRSAAGRPG